MDARASSLVGGVAVTGTAAGEVVLFSTSDLTYGFSHVLFAAFVLAVS